MNRRNLFKSVGAAIALMAIPVVASAVTHHHFRICYVERWYGLYDDDGKQIMAPQLWRTYHMTIRHGDGGITFYSVDAEVRDDAKYRQYMERQVARYDSSRGRRSSDASADLGFSCATMGSDVRYVEEV